MQPLQIKGFEEAGNMSLFLINCNMGGINIDWNKVGSFNTFPPQQNTIKRPDTLLVLQNDIKFYRALKQNSMASQSDYTFVVFWSRFMHRQSKKLVKQILDYQNKHSDKKINSFFVNVDNLYSRQK